MDSVFPVTDPSLDPLTNLIEENAIRKIEAYYVLCVDTRNFKGLSQVFVPDVVADYSDRIGVVNGLEALAGVIEMMTAPVRGYHQIGTQLITIHPPSLGEQPTQANAITYIEANLFGKGDKDGKALYAYFRYEDTLAKGPEGWRITRRNLTYTGPNMGDISIFGISE